MSVITAGSPMVGTPINLVRGLIRLGLIKVMPNSFLSKTQLLMINQLQDVSTRRSLSTAYCSKKNLASDPVRS